MEYKINHVRIPESDYECIGLFSEDSSWRGEGSCCGWYAVELYTHGTLLAYYEIDKTFGRYSPKGHPHHNNVVANKKFDEIIIGSCYWESTLEADNDEDAIKKFFNEEFDSRF